MKHFSSVFLAFLALALFASTCNALKVGDRGKGWRVLEDKNGNPYCAYKGKFRIQGEVRDINSATGGACPTPRPQIKAKGRKVSLRNSGSVWTISTVKGNQLIKKGKKGYLTPTTDVQTAEWNTNVVMKVTRKKTKWTIGPEDGSSIEDMDDCLQGLRLSTSGTNLNYDCANREFRYDDEESSWSLIAV